MKANGIAERGCGLASEWEKDEGGGIRQTQEVKCPGLFDSRWNQECQETERRKTRANGDLQQEPQVPFLASAHLLCKVHQCTKLKIVPKHCWMWSPN